MEIKLKEDYNVYDAGDELRIQELISSLDFESTSEIILNFQHCMVDYPYTSRLIDTAINHLISIQGETSLEILIQLENLEDVVLNSLFLGSTCLGIQDSSDFLSKEQISEAIEENLTKRNIHLEIKLIDFHGNVKKKYY